MLYFLGCELYFGSKAGQRRSLPFFYCGFYIQMCVPGDLSGISDYQYKTCDRRKRFLGFAGRMLYSIDAADNLFPSIHCLVSWFCFLAVKGQKKIPIWYKAVSFILAVLVFLSTLFTKQHVIVDVAGGIFLAQGCFWIGKHTEIWHIYEHIGNKIEKAITKYIEGKTK